MTLYQLAASGDEDSISLVKKLGLTQDTQNSANTNSDSVKLLIESLLMDMRYHTIEKLAMSEADMQYISSLRVLLIMKKNSKGGFFLDNVRPQVMEILETTGFDSIFFGE